MLAVLIALTFSACDDDKDDEPATGNTESNGKTELIGKWESVDDNWGYQFNGGGKGYGVEYSEYSDRSDIWPISWKYRNNILTIIDEDEYGDIVSLTVNYIDDEMIIARDSDGDSYTLYKVRKFSWE